MTHYLLSGNFSLRVAKSYFIWDNFALFSDKELVLWQKLTCCTDSREKWIYCERLRFVTRLLLTWEKFDYGTRCVATKIAKSVWSEITDFKQKFKYSFVLTIVGSHKTAKLWVARVMLLLQIHAKRCEKESQCAFALYIDVTSLRESVDRALNSVSLRWGTDSKIDHTLAQKKQSSGVQMLKAN